MPMIMSDAHKMIFVNDHPIHTFTIEVPFGSKDQSIRFGEVINLQAVHNIMPRSYLERIVEEAEKTFTSPIILNHTFKTPCGRDFPFTRKDLENLKMIMRVFTPNELLRELKNKKGVIIK